eukprot:13219171-Ditylum_brightwellii.AAC.1
MSSAAYNILVHRSGAINSGHGRGGQRHRGRNNDGRGEGRGHGNYCTAFVQHRREDCIPGTNGQINICVKCYMRNKPGHIANTCSGENCASNANLLMNVRWCKSGEDLAVVTNGGSKYFEQHWQPYKEYKPQWKRNKRGLSQYGMKERSSNLKNAVKDYTIMIQLKAAVENKSMTIQER